MPQRRKIIAANWKMNGLSASADTLTGALVKAMDAQDNVVICPSFTLIGQVGQAIRGTSLNLGAQDCRAQDAGAYTGDISAPMLADAGCRYVILGHSERRLYHTETDAQIQEKAIAAHKAGLIAIICVGETEQERDAGRAQEVVGSQMRGSIPASASAANTVVAYEPVWAIGTGNTATAEDIAAMHDHINGLGAQHWPAWGGRVNALYGGSVKAGNAFEILIIPSVGGALVGGASLDAKEFAAIVDAANQPACEPR